MVQILHIRYTCMKLFLFFYFFLLFFDKHHHHSGMNTNTLVIGFQKVESECLQIMNHFMRHNARMYGHAGGQQYCLNGEGKEEGKEEKSIFLTGLGGSYKFELDRHT